MDRYNDELMQSFKIDSKKSTEPKDLKIVRYREDGTDDVKRQKKFTDLETCIKAVNKKNPEFMAKMNRRGELFDPLQKSMRYDLSSKDKGTGVDTFQYKTINKNAFDFYLSYLKTKQERFLTLANREINNGF